MGGGVHVLNTSFVLECISYTFHEINRYMITIYHQQNEIRVRFSMLSIIFFTLKKREKKTDLILITWLCYQTLSITILSVSSSENSSYSIVENFSIFGYFLNHRFPITLNAGVFWDRMNSILWTLKNSLKSILTCRIYSL